MDKFKDYSFDGFGINGRDEYRERLATVTRAGHREQIGERIAVALNSFEQAKRFIDGIDEIIRMGKPSDVLWNYCVEHRAEIVALMEGKTNEPTPA